MTSPPNLAGSLSSTGSYDHRGVTAAGRDGAPAREAWWLIAGFTALLFVLRFAAARFGTFAEGDEISIASGVAAVQRGVTGDTYRYGVQVGYYHLVSAITSLLGGRLLTIPDVMTWLSVLGGTAIPVAGALAFRHDLSRHERWLVGALLAANPVIWQAARYGNTATVSVAFTVIALAVLSNRPQRMGEAAAMACLAVAIFLRADAVLASGVAFALLWRTHRALVRSALPLVVCGAVVAVTFAWLLANDPRMGDVVGSVASHGSDEILTRFLEFLLVGMSPVPLLMAAAGARDLQRERPLLLAILAAWVVPFGVFYYTNTTSPRYLMQLMPPLCIAAAVGILRSFAASGWARTVSKAVVLTLSFVHLLVGLTNFNPARKRSWLTEATLPSHDGPVYTGALLYKTFVLRPDHEKAWWRLRRFAPSNQAERSLVQLFDSVATPGWQPRPVVLVTAGGYGNELHFMAHVAGASIVGQEPGVSFNRVTRFRLREQELVAVGVPDLESRKGHLPVRAGDELWALYFSRERAANELRALLPPGLALASLPDWPRAERLWPFRVIDTPIVR
jgi:hypothetical protein